MAGKRDKPEEIVLKLRQVEVLQGQGIALADDNGADDPHAGRAGDVGDDMMQL